MRYVLAFLAIACSDPRAQPPPPQVRDVQLRDAGVPPPDASPMFIGVVTASETIEISSRFTGIVQTIKVGVGDDVAANQVVAVMDAAQQQDELSAANAALNAASSAVNAAQVEVTSAKRKVATVQHGYEEGISSRQELEDARDNLSRAQAALQTTHASVAAAAARAKTARDLAASSELRTPFAGKVAAKLIGAGGRTEAGAPILRIVAGGKLRVRFAVPPDKKVQLDTQITADVGSGDQRARITATIRYRAPTIDTSSQMLIVEAELVDDSLDIQPGLPAWVHPF